MNSTRMLKFNACTAFAILAASLLGMSCNSPDVVPQTSNNVKSSGPNGSLVCGCGGSCTSTAGDGIPDTWKTIGVDSTCSGQVDLDLTTFNASPRHKDIFLQIDTMAPRPDGTAEFDLPQATIDLLVQAFNNSPVTNPDGTTGIHLHVIRGNQVPYHRVTNLYPEFNTPQCAGANYPGLQVKDIKNQNMDAPHQLVFHYGIIADFNTFDTYADQLRCGSDGEVVVGSSGLSVINGKSFVISMGSFMNTVFGNISNMKASTNFPRQLAGTIMHELGHNFGLRHGGDADMPNYKPNYLSVMNYAYQYGVPLANADGSLASPPTTWRLDYSRETLATLNEDGHLNEFTGLGSSDPTLEFHFFDSSCTPRMALAHGPVDWSGDGAIDSTVVSSDLNPTEDPSRNCGDVTTEVMTGHEDWSTLNYGFYNLTAQPVGPNGSTDSSLGF